ncbi:MAG: hypothetical protein LBF57_00845 [Holosporaceae bacterium]|jgi:hypothetical protein|nr:hypothetical protein [Holosporaceae bacterium]
MMKKLFNTRVRIEALERKLSADNLWVSEYKLWSEVWAAISIKDISSKRVLYLFTLKWKEDFPRDFRVVIKDRIFIPTQSPIVEPENDLILFHAVLK